MTRSWLPTLVLMAAAAAAAWQLKGTPAPGPRKVEVDTIWAEQARPELRDRSLGDRLTTSIVKPAQTQIALAPSSAGRQAVADYCKPLVLDLGPRLRIPGATLVQTTATDSVSMDEPPARLPDFRGDHDGPRLTLFSTLNDGRRWSSEYSARGRIRFQTDGDSVLVTGDRLWVRVTRGAWKCAPAMGGSGAIGALTTEDPFRGLAFGALAAAAGCIVSGL